MTICKKSAMPSHRSANLRSRRPLRRRMLPTLVLALTKTSHFQAGQTVATVRRYLPRTSLSSMMATPKQTRTASMLGPFQSNQVLSRSHLSPPHITKWTPIPWNPVHPSPSPKFTRAPSTSRTRQQNPSQR